MFLLLLITIAVDAVTIINYHIGGKTNIVMLISKLTLKEFE